MLYKVVEWSFRCVPRIPCMAQEAASSRDGSQPPHAARPAAGSFLRYIELTPIETSVCFCLTPHMLLPHMPSYAGQICLCRGLSEETWVGTWDSRINRIFVAIGKRDPSALWPLGEIPLCEESPRATGG